MIKVGSSNWDLDSASCLTETRTIIVQISNRKENPINLSKSKKWLGSDEKSIL